MRQLPFRARYYLFFCYVVGAGAAGWLVLSDWHWLTRSDWLLAAALTGIAALCQTFVVKRAGQSHSDHLTQAPLCAALLLLPNPLLAVAMIGAFIPEWYVYRRQWYIESFNIAEYLIAAAVGRWVLHVIALLYPEWVSYSLAAISFLAVQTLLLAWVLKLARGQQIYKSELLAPRKLFVEITLLAVGIGFAISWRVSPVFGVIAALPLALIFEALHVPNLKQEAATDPKTGLANMRHFNALMAREIDRAERTHQQFSILMCDLDYLRNINNTYGHQAGDIVLVRIAEIIQHSIRGSDVAARFGGEEFVVLLSGQDSDAAQSVAERVREELESSIFDIGHPDGSIHATISVGVAAFPGDGRTAEMLMHEADLAVYQAKREGRNRVSVAGRTSRELAGEWTREHLVTAPITSTTTSTTAGKNTARWQVVSDVTRDRINEDPARVAQTTAMRSSPVRKPNIQGTPLAVYAVISAIVMGGLLGLLPNLLPSLAHLHIWLLPLALFVGLTVASEYVAIDMFGRGKTSVALVVVLTASFLFGPVGIFCTALALPLSIGMKARSPLHRIWFNFGTVLLSAEAAHATLIVLSPGGMGEISARTFVGLLIPAMAAGLVYYAVNHLLLCIIRGLHERRLPWQVWTAEYRWLWPHYVVLGGLSLVITVGYQLLGVAGVLALMSPVAMMHVALKQYMDHTRVHVDELERVNQRLTDSYESTLQALMRALDSRDEETEAHSQRVKNLSAWMAKQLGVPEGEQEHIMRGALLHDIGKIGVPDAILLKPGRLTGDEHQIMRKHPEIGYAMIAHIPFLSQAARVVLHHHESYDGRGYPSGLAGEAIPLGARIFAVADTFDAMTSERPYRQALTAEAAFAELKRCSGTQFDPTVVQAFLGISFDELKAIQPTLRRLGEEIESEQHMPVLVAA